MADEGKEEKEGGEQPKKKSKKMLIIIIVVVLLLVVGGAAAYFLLFAGKPAPEEDAAAALKKTVPTESTEIGQTYPIETFIVNLANPLGKRYLKVTMQLELDNPKMTAELDRRMPQLRDAILTILSSKTYEDISTSQGKLRLRSEIVARVNAFLTSGSIRRVYFTEFVVQ